MTRAEIAEIYHTPLLELVARAGQVHRANSKQDVMKAELLSVKTGGCPEDCGYCPQSAHFETGVNNHKLLSVETVTQIAAQAKANGADRFCMGAAWRNLKQGEEFEKILQMVRSVSALGLQTCCTMGMVTLEQATRLKEAGLHAYNHNIDTGRDYYQKIISTREFDDRLKTIQNLTHAGISVCCGGIVGMGETDDDRIDFLHELTLLPKAPESIPVNHYVPVSGVPLRDKANPDFFSMLRVIATARILFPLSRIRLSAGRKQMTAAEQMLCFLAGVNSVFSGEKLLTTPNASHDSDAELFNLLGLHSYAETQPLPA